MNKRQSKTLAKHMASALIDASIGSGFMPETGSESDDVKTLTALDWLAQDLFSAASRSPDQPPANMRPPGH